jgi:small conductance mechanosensitive channel
MPPVSLSLPCAVAWPQVREWLTAHLGVAGLSLGLRLVGSLLILVGGLWASAWIARALRRIFDRAGAQPIVASFTTNLAKAVFIILTLVAAVTNFGFPLTPVLAVLGAAGLAVGLALQGTLSNLASGVLLAVLRPFNVGDFIEVVGLSGTVEAVHIFQTRLVTPDNRVIIMPNSQLTNTPLINCTVKGIRRLDLVFSVSYGDDLSKVKKILEDLLAGDPRVLPDPAPSVGVLTLADSSIHFAVRPWVKAGDYWSLHFDLNQQVKQRFDTEGITIPFPQRVVHTTGEIKSPPTDTPKTGNLKPNT